jgi:hypothetical protein
MSMPFVFPSSKLDNGWKNSSAVPRINPHSSSRCTDVRKASRRFASVVFVSSNVNNGHFVICVCQKSLNADFTGMIHHSPGRASGGSCRCRTVSRSVKLNVATFSASSFSGGCTPTFIALSPDNRSCRVRGGRSKTRVVRSLTACCSS